MNRSKYSFFANQIGLQWWLRFRLVLGLLSLDSEGILTPMRKSCSPCLFGLEYLFIFILGKEIRLKGTNSSRKVSQCRMCLTLFVMYWIQVQICPIGFLVVLEPHTFQMLGSKPLHVRLS